MAAAIPATNKWLLTKQASVALSGLWDDRHGAERRPGDRAGGRRGSLNSGPLLLTWVQPGPRWRPESGDEPLVERGGHTPEEPSGERKQEENESGWGTRGKGGASGMARWVQLHGVSWVQWASCPLFFHLWALCQIQSTWLSSYGNQLTALSPSSSHSDSITNTPLPSHSLPLSLILSPSLWWLHRAVHLWIFWLNLRMVCSVLSFSHFKVSVL